MAEKHFNDLTPAEAERLAILMEECAEVVAICGKILRHGYQSRNPIGPDFRTNRELLEHELGDVQHIVGRMVDAGDVERVVIEEFAEKKAAKIWRYLHHQDHEARDA